MPTSNDLGPLSRCREHGENVHGSDIDPHCLNPTSGTACNQSNQSNHMSVTQRTSPPTWQRPHCRMLYLCDSYATAILYTYSTNQNVHCPHPRIPSYIAQLPQIAKHCQASLPAGADIGDSDVGATIGEIACEYKLRWVGWAILSGDRYHNVVE